MPYNAQRQRVTREWHKGMPSSCPDCESDLLARRSDLPGGPIWHWAHYPKDRNKSERMDCGSHAETPWHLAWKETFSRMPGWTVEERIGDYRADAINLEKRIIFEFIHCLSPYYVNKHRALAKLDYTVQWIFDAGEFASTRSQPFIARTGQLAIARLLKPTAYDLYQRLNRRAWVHFSGRGQAHGIWEEWKDDIWFQKKMGALEHVLAFDLIYSGMTKIA